VRKVGGKGNDNDSLSGAAGDDTLDGGRGRDPEQSKGTGVVLVR
jgi:Ca2+-binding RTX toxin-like protein